MEYDSKFKKKKRREKNRRAKRKNKRGKERREGVKHLLRREKKNSVERKKKKQKNIRKGTLSAKKQEGSTWLPSQEKSFEKPKRPSLVFTVALVFCAGLILILRCCLEREARIILASHRVMILVRVSHVLPPMIAPRGGH